VKPGDLVRFVEKSAIFRERGETLAIVTRVSPLEGTSIFYLHLLMPTGETRVRRADDVEIVEAAGEEG
jgi:hypothetical protein